MPDALDNSICPVWFVRLHSRTISNANAAALALTGHSEDEIKGKRLEELFAPDAVTYILTRSQACGNVESGFESVAVIKKDQSMQHLEVFWQIPSQEQSLILILGNMP
jgi:PAS domain S-box-containing protein